jgi:hypothetical protein
VQGHEEGEGRVHLPVRRGEVPGTHRAPQGLPAK